MAQESAKQFGLMRRARARVHFFALVAALLAAALVARGATREAEGGADRSLATWLARHQLKLLEAPIWLAPPQGALGLRPVLFLAHHAGELSDLYYAQIRAGDSGALLDAFVLTNVTHSSSADERGLTRVGPFVAFTARVGEQSDAIAVLDTRGEPAQLTQGWPFYARVQNAITNLQETGRPGGFGRVHYRLVPPADSLELGAEAERFVVHADGERIILDPTRIDPIEGKARVRAQQTQKGRPGTITWVVDSVRNVSWIGPEPVAWLEHSVFGVTDRVTRAYHRFFPDEDTGAEMRSALRAPSTAAKPAAPPEPAPSLAPESIESLLAVGEPEFDLPPAPLHPMLPDHVSGEGHWIALQGDAFVNAYPNAPGAFYQTFLRVDPERPYESVYITLWDARQIQLHLAMGTQEPESATGETGTGLIPRDPELLSRLVGAFNGGFQALHGEFGMMAEGRVYLPPKPYAATVAVYEDGRVGMGSWPGPGRGTWDEETANAQIPHDMVGMRQNLTSVVEGSAYNPWERWWWGAAPEWAEDQTYIARSGLCVTEAGHMAYFWGESMGPEEMGKAMLAVRCVRGMHLDMNTKHTGFEFYHPFAPGSTLPDLGRKLAEGEAQGPIEQGLGFTFRTRLAVKTMSPLRFPRYLARDPRDYFFLTLKSVLPGPAVTVDDKPVAFSSSGLPQAGWPAAFARARIAGEDVDAKSGDGTWLVRIDPARAIPAPLAPAELDRPLAWLHGLPPAAAASGRLALYATRAHGVLRYRVGTPVRDTNIVVRGDELVEGMQAMRAIGVDREGFLLYAEAAPGDSAVLAARLRQAGVQRAIVLPEHARLSFAAGDKRVSVDGLHELHPEGDGIALMAETRPAAQVIFGDVKPAPYWRWAAAQGQRVRYFPQNAPTARAPEEAMRPKPAQPQAPDASVPAVPPTQ